MTRTINEADVYLEVGNRSGNLFRVADMNRDLRGAMCFAKCCDQPRHHVVTNGCAGTYPQPGRGRFPRSAKLTFYVLCAIQHATRLR